MEKTVKVRSKRQFMKGYFVVFLVLLALFVFMTFASKNFLTYDNLYNLARATAVYGIVALAMTFVIVTGGIDLSVGTNLGLASMLFTLLIEEAGWAVPPAIIFAIIACGCIGAINGVLIHDGKLPPFIATLGMKTIVRATILLISGGKNISIHNASFNNFATLTIGVPGVDAYGNETTLGIPVMVLVWVILIVISFFIFRYTTFGRNVFACGSNVNAARLSGISVRKTIYGAFIVSAVFCAIGGLLSASRLRSGIPTLGDGYEEDAIAAAVIGGASMAGGEGYIGGTVVGSLLIATIKNAGTLLGFDTNVTKLVIGALIIVAVLIDRFKKH
ncbi:MAG: ABC transporter permease [Clostridia bacterium]|nr:ABC transporter permease [Clostridia bacterium]